MGFICSTVNRIIQPNLNKKKECNEWWSSNILLGVINVLRDTAFLSVSPPLVFVRLAFPRSTFHVSIVISWREAIIYKQSVIVVCHAA